MSMKSHKVSLGQAIIQQQNNDNTNDREDGSVSGKTLPNHLDAIHAKHMPKKSRQQRLLNHSADCNWSHYVY